MANEAVTQYTADDYIKYIAEILSYIEDPSYIRKIYSIVYSKWKSEGKEGRDNA